MGGKLINGVMEYHPDKCDVISVTRKKKPITYPYYIRGPHHKHVDYVICITLPVNT